MATEAEDPGFLSRWSRRKVQQRQGAALAEPAAAAAPCAAIAAIAPPDCLPAAIVPSAAAAPADATSAPAEAPAQPSPTLADVALLTRESDYTRFIGSSVQPDVKNAALAKLFTDPHFNVMDRLDVYIDDYGKPDPLPAGMLRQMVQAHVLGLFDAEDEELKTALPTPTAVLAEAAAHPLPTEPAPDEDTDLQLQPDDGAGRPGPEAGAGEDAGLPH